jgi:hypothetical protein
MVCSVNAERFVVIAKFDRYFEERHGFTGEHGLVDNVGATEEVSRDGGFGLEADKEDDITQK